MIQHHYYAKQLKRFILGFSGVFSGLQVHGGVDQAGVPIMITVPIRYGSADRVVSAISTSHTQNKLHTLPIMSCFMTGIDLAPDRLHGVNQVDQQTYIEQGGVYPDDIKTITRVMAIPYNMQLELCIYTSNTDQMFQILEQILLLFDYNLQLQFNDSAFDWTKITQLQLTNLQSEENYPSGSENRIVMWSLNFQMPIWLSPPMEVRKDIINSIRVRLGDLDSMVLNEVDDHGNLVPFTDLFDEFVIDPDTKPLDPTNPGIIVEKVLAGHYDPSLDSNCGKA